MTCESPAPFSFYEKTNSAFLYSMTGLFSTQPRVYSTTRYFLPELRPAPPALQNICLTAWPLKILSTSLFLNIFRLKPFQTATRSRVGLLNILVGTFVLPRTSPSFYDISETKCATNLSLSGVMSMGKTKPAKKSLEFRSVRIPDGWQYLSVTTNQHHVTTP